jgi:hypothetical protein
MPPKMEVFVPGHRITLVILADFGQASRSFATLPAISLELHYLTNRSCERARAPSPTTTPFEAPCFSFISRT